MLESVTRRQETAVGALTVSHDPEQSWDDSVRFWEEMEWPEGSKVEILRGDHHRVTCSRVPPRRDRGTHPASPPLRDPRGLRSVPAPAIAVPSRLGMLIPDLVVAPVREDSESDSHVPAALA